MVRNSDETPAERFKRLASLRTNSVLERLRILGNCSNRQVYEYTKQDIDKIFTAIEHEVKATKSKFHFSNREHFKL